MRSWSYLYNHLIELVLSSGEWLAGETSWWKGGRLIQGERCHICKWLYRTICYSGTKDSLASSPLLISMKHCWFLKKWIFLPHCILSGFLRFYSFLLFQGVHSMLDGCPAKPWGPDEKRINKLVFIGRNLDEAALRKAFKGCFIWECLLKGEIVVTCILLGCLIRVHDWKAK